MPAYAIKILERLHHMFEGIDNVLVIIAIDSNQLNQSIIIVYIRRIFIQMNNG